jgi:hypothetical protein
LRPEAGSPTLRGSRDQHCARGGAGLAHRHPVHRSGKTAASKLRAVARAIGDALLDPNLRPVRVEFLGDQHRQHGLDALTDFGVLADDRDGVVGVDRDECVDRGRSSSAAAGSSAREPREAGGQRKTAADQGARLEQHAA